MHPTRSGRCCFRQKSGYSAASNNCRDAGTPRKPSVRSAGIPSSCCEIRVESTSGHIRAANCPPLRARKKAAEKPGKSSVPIRFAIQTFAHIAHAHKPVLKGDKRPEFIQAVTAQYLYRPSEPCLVANRSRAGQSISAPSGQMTPSPHAARRG